MKDQSFESKTENKMSTPEHVNAHLAAREIKRANSPCFQQNWLKTVASPRDPGTPNTHADVLIQAKAAGMLRTQRFLNRLQRLHGNHYVQRVLNMARNGQGEPEVHPEIEQAINRKRGGGQALDNKVQNQMESAMGTDFSSVRVHTDVDADALNQNLNARAFTTGQDIFFRNGEYQPGNSNGRELLAHELTHVVQQTGGLRPKMGLGHPGDKYEQEADQVARAVIRHEQRIPNEQEDMGAVHRQLEEEEEEFIQTKSNDSMQRQLSEVEEEAELQTKSLNGMVQKRALTPFNTFNKDEVRTPIQTKRAHVVQQRHRPRAGIVMRRPAAAQAPVRTATVKEAAEFLEAMTLFIEGARIFALTIMRPTLPSRQPTPAARRRAHQVLNQQKLRDMLARARRIFDVQAGALQAGSADGTRLRKALLSVIAKIRQVAPVALNISSGMPAPTPSNERRLNAELVVELIEADPFTSTGMAGTPAFGAAETAAGASHETFIEAYLDDLIRTLPGQTLAAAQRDRILARILAGLRRAFITVGVGAAGTRGVRGITNPRIVSKYRRAMELLSAGMSARPPQQSIITTSLPAYVLPNPVPNVTAQLQANPNIGTVDVSRVPSNEQASVRYGVLQAANTGFPAGSTAQRRNASWPVAFQVRRRANIIRVRYDLIFDNASNVRVERLGEAEPRQVAPAFARLGLAAKKAQLIADFALAGVDDRPAVPGRAVAVWTPTELDQIKAAYDLLPARDRSSLRGVTIVRDHQGPATVAGLILTGIAHTGPSPAHDSPGPPAHPPPHIHYYDAAFAQNRVTAVGAPGSTGPGGDWTIAHEVGHMRIFRAIRQANAAIVVANAQIVAANAGIPALNAALPQAQHQLRQAYNQARNAANAAIQAFNAAVIATPPPTPAQRAPLLQAAQAAVVARNQARANLAAGGVPAAMVQAATNLDAAQDASLAATQSLGVSQDQIPIFISLAGTFGFTPFTDYARRGGNDEFFAETYTLYITDPNRLSAMNRRIFLWFEVGMPMNPGWRPPP